MDDAPFGFSPAAALSRKELEEGNVFAPRFDADGLIPAIAQHTETGDVLMRWGTRSKPVRRGTGAAAAMNCGTRVRRAAKSRRSPKYGQTAIRM
jgi:hypothetical protein